MISSKRDILDYWFSHNKVKDFRGKKTLVQIAEEIGIDQGHLSNILNGKIGLYLYRLVQIAESLGCKPADLLPDAWQSATPTNNERILSNIAIVTQVVEEYLMAKHKTLNPAAKGELIASLCEVAETVEETQAKKAKIIEFTDFALKRAL